MIATLFWAFGLVLIIEGLAFALAPSRIEEVLRVLASLPEPRKRQLGLLASALGGVFILAARLL